MEEICMLDGTFVHYLLHNLQYECVNHLALHTVSLSNGKKSTYSNINSNI